ncbi:AraC family transcriptional regulator [Spirosoma spitsbergense]|uniref:AraC family transcriptional regulator n=1 Tax=Spirosoma spitsbergense TaxID=431554 RepID=UPI00037A84F7
MIVKIRIFLFPFYSPSALTQFSEQSPLSEIAHQLNYSSVAHLSSQFKKVTGLTPRFFKQLKHKKRYMLESL